MLCSGIDFRHIFVLYGKIIVLHQKGYDTVDKSQGPHDSRDNVGIAK